MPARWRPLASLGVRVWLNPVHACRMIALQSTIAVPKSCTSMCCPGNESRRLPDGMDVALDVVLARRQVTHRSTTSSARCRSPTIVSGEALVHDRSQAPPRAPGCRRGRDLVIGRRSHRQTGYRAPSNGRPCECCRSVVEPDSAGHVRFRHRSPPPEGFHGRQYACQCTTTPWRVASGMSNVPGPASLMYSTDAKQSSSVSSILGCMCPVSPLLQRATMRRMVIHRLKIDRPNVDPDDEGDERQRRGLPATETSAVRAGLGFTMQ